MDNITLPQIQERLDFIANKIEQYFNTVNTPDNIILKKDSAWGNRTINLFIRIDEFSIEKLKESIPKLQELFKKYKSLRAEESAFLDAALIERTINPMSKAEDW